MAASIAVNTEPFAPRKTAIILGKPLPATTDPAAFESLQLALVASLQDDVLRLDPVTGRLDDTNFEARVVPAERFVRAELDRIDLNRYLPAAATSTGAEEESDARGARRGTREVRHRRGDPDRTRPVSRARRCAMR